MSVVVIGLNHRQVPLEILERLTVGADMLPKALADVSSRPNVSEAVVLSTCNRIEVYAYAEKFHGAYQDVRDFLGQWGHLAPEDFSDYLYTHYDADAFAHLFGVASGLDSAVLGENEIQAQVKSAWDVARAESTSGTTLNALFRHALEVGKRARTETGISRNITSVAQAAVALAAQELDGLNGRNVLILGAGEMGEGMAKALASAAPADLAFVNRSLVRAESLASRVGGRARPLSELEDALVSADVLLTSTGAAAMLVEQATLVAVMARRPERPLLIVDIAVPRDIDPSAGELDGVTLLDMDDLRAFADHGARERQGEIERVRAIIGDEVERLLGLQSARMVAPLVTMFRADLDALREVEIERHAAKLADLTPAQREAVDALTKGLINKVAHTPTVRLNEAGGTPRGSRLADALRDLFDL